MREIRLQQTLAMLRESGIVHCHQLQQHFGITAMTVWRDLETLEANGQLRRVRGGAVAVDAAAGEPLFEEKRRAQAEIKHRIAAAAVEAFVSAGQTLALEGGTTVAAIVDALPQERLSILTNSLPVALKARQNRPLLPVQVIGGWLSPVSGNVTGPETLRAIAKCRVDLCFLSATGFDAKRGPTDPNPLEIEVKRGWAAVARKTVLLADSEKFSRQAAHVTLHPRRLHAVVTDNAPPEECAELLTRHGVRLLVIGS